MAASAHWAAQGSPSGIIRQPQRALKQVLTRHAKHLRCHLRSPGGRQLIEQRPQQPVRIHGVRRSGLPAARDQEHELASFLRVAGSEVRCDLPKRPPVVCLEPLGELPADPGLPLAPEHLGSIRQRRGDAMRRFIERESCGLRSEAVKRSFARSGSGRKEPRKQKAVCRKASHRQCRRQRAGTRDRPNRETRSRCGPDQTIPGVRQQRRPRVTDQGQVFARAQARKQSGYTSFFIMFVDREQRRVDPPVR